MYLQTLETHPASFGACYPHSQKHTTSYVQLLCQCSETEAQRLQLRLAFSSTIRGQNDEGALGERATATDGTFAVENRNSLAVFALLINRQAGLVPAFSRALYSSAHFSAPSGSCLTSDPISSFASDCCNSAKAVMHSGFC